MNITKYTGKKKMFNCTATHFKMVVMSFCLAISFLLITKPAAAQELPPKPISVEVSSEQHLEFGSIIVAGAGTVTITYSGARILSGSLYEKSSTFSPALFIVRCLPGTLIAIQSIKTFPLTNGTHDLPLTINKDTDTNTGSQFVSTTGTTNVYIGGTLSVSLLLNNPKGPYYAEFVVTFIQQ